MRGSTRSRRRLLRRRPSPTKGEAFIAAYTFPPHIERGAQRKHPGLSAAELGLVEQGLREWLVCCAWRGGATLAMPSRVVDTAWHELILDSASYMDFCDHAYGEYLHHIPEGEDRLDLGDGQVQLIHAWDRSRMGRQRGESVLWDLDARLRIADGLGVDPARRQTVRASYAPAGGGGHGGWWWLDWSGDGNGADAGGAADAGGGCGGGGCGGGCGGGG